MEVFDKKNLAPIIGWTPADFIAVLLIAVCGLLIYAGYNGTIHSLLLAIAATYFGISHVQRQK